MKQNGCLRLAGAGLAVVADTLTTLTTSAETVALALLGVLGGLLAVVGAAGVAVAESYPIGVSAGRGGVAADCETWS